MGDIDRGETLYLKDTCPSSNSEILKSWKSSNSILREKISKIKNCLIDSNGHQKEEQIFHLKEISNNGIIIVHPVCPEHDHFVYRGIKNFKAQCNDYAYLRIYRPTEEGEINLSTQINENGVDSIVLKPKPSCVFSGLDYISIFNILESDKKRCYIEYKPFYPFCSVLSPELWLSFTIDQFLDVIQEDEYKN